MPRLTALATIAAVLPLATALAAPLSKTDRIFIHKAAVGGMTEVQEGQTALSSASSADVKSFAQKMVDAHTANNQELMQLVASKGATTPTMLDKMQQKQLDGLTKVKAGGFDSAYVQDQVKDHQAMEKVMQNEIDNGSDADLKAFAQKTLPVVQDHLNMAMGLKGS